MPASLRTTVILLALGTLLTACGGEKPLVPISDHSTALRYPESEYRVVVAGDTLYSIAWEAGRDYRELAKWNQIRAPYTLRPGQKVHLFPPTQAAARTAEDYRIVAAGDTLYGIAADVGVHYRELAKWNDIPPPYVIKPGQRLRITPSARGTSVSARKSRARDATRGANTGSAAASAAAPPRTIGSWTWPANGRILARFMHNGPNKGLDIAGQRGETIRAAAAGRVVYQGSGLRGYGQLIIIKHNRNFLSAYAHTDRAYVEEGDVIKRGQKIAAMGSSGTDRVKLHFEIRYRGSPVDPLKYLPKR